MRSVTHLTMNYTLCRANEQFLSMFVLDDMFEIRYCYVIVEYARYIVTPGYHVRGGKVVVNEP